MKIRRFVLAAGLGALLPSLSPAQEPGSELRIGLITMGPGPEIFERFGHNAIAIEDTVNGRATWYNYGMFSFAQDNFLLNFIKGRMEYWMEGRDPYYDLQGYMQRGRSVSVQWLNLTAAQKSELRDIMVSTDTPANRFYRYDYYRDNCSTRIRDVIDGVLGGAIAAQTGGGVGGVTLRTHTARVTTNNKLMHTGLMIGLGPGVDREMTAWDEMFLPLAMRDRFEELEVPLPDGTTASLVASREVLFASEMWPVDDAPPRWGIYYLVLGLVVALTIGATSRIGAPRARGSLPFTLLSTTWLATTGILGTVLLGLWVLTDHAIAYRNENLFLLNPASLFLAFLIPLIWARVGWAGRAARPTAWLVAGLSTAGLVLQILPGLDQVNGLVYSLVLPANLVVARAVTDFARRGGEARATPPESHAP